VAGGQELRHYAPGELKQWQAYEEYTSSREDVEDIVRALKGAPAEPEVAGGPWKDKDALSLAWQLEVMEADQEAHLAMVDQGEEGLAAILAPETLGEPEDFTVSPGEKEVLDPETARLRYLLWQRELGALLTPESLPLLLGRTARTIFASLRQEAGGGKAPQVRFTLPGCRTEDQYHVAKNGERAVGWQREFDRMLGACLTAADQGADLERPASELTQWLAEELPQQWPGIPLWTWDLEIWNREPKTREGGEALLAWGGLGKEVVPG
jgi:hypothetical protein